MENHIIHSTSLNEASVRKKPTFPQNTSFTKTQIAVEWVGNPMV